VVKHGCPRNRLSFLLILVSIGWILDQSALAYTRSNSNPPVVENVSSVLFGGFVYVSGYVTDDTDPTGLTVHFGGNVSGTATVGADGRFWFRAPFYYPYGTGSVKTQDADGNKSNTVIFEFHE
jgi:hypothetical protein